MVVFKIHGLESSWGKNDRCTKQGKINGYGFMQSKFHWKCFDTHEEVKNLVHNWVKNRLEEGYSLSELLCYYNQGKRVQNCPYYQNYLKLNEPR